MSIYQKMFNLYPEIKELLTFHIQEMCQSVSQINNRDFSVDNDRIGYKLADHSISYTLDYKYETTFAYF